MYTISFQHTRITQVFYFSEGGSPEGFNSHETSKPKTIDQLTEIQRSEVDNILEQLDQNPEIGRQIGITLKGVYDTITHNPERLHALLEAIEQTKQAKLDDITSQFNSGKITGQMATTLSHDTVTHYGHLAQKSFQDSFSPTLATA